MGEISKPRFHRSPVVSLSSMVGWLIYMWNGLTPKYTPKKRTKNRPGIMGMVHLFTYMESRVDGDCGGGGTGGLVDSAYTCPVVPRGAGRRSKAGKAHFYPFMRQLTVYTHIRTHWAPINHVISTQFNTKHIHKVRVVSVQARNLNFQLGFAQLV